MKKFSEISSEKKVEPLVLPKTPSKGMYILTYQATSNLYARMNLKVELVKKLMEVGGDDFESYTDSTILFTGTYSKGQYLKFMTAIETAVGEELHPRFYYTLAGIIRDSDATNMITIRRDHDLNTHFQKAIDHLKKKD